jgi:hypothetical protein
MDQDDRHHLPAYGEPAQLDKEKQVSLVGGIRSENGWGSW